MMHRCTFLTPPLLRHLHLHPRPHPSRQTIRTPARGIRGLMASLPPQKAFLETPFPESVSLAHTLLKDLPEPLPSEHRAAISALLQTSAGTRGLFVALLSHEEVTAADVPFHEDLGGMLSQPQGTEVVTLGVKNVVMSSAMVVTYHGKGEHQLAEGSRMTSDRAVRVLKQLGGNVLPVAKKMIEGLREQKGEFAAFGQKWGYGEQEVDAAVAKLVEALGEDVI